MQRNTWRAVNANDEYRASGDTHYFDSPKYSYYWNEGSKTMRRFGVDGSYCEVGCFRRPPAKDVASRFALGKSQNRLKAVEPPTPPLNM